MNYFTLPLFFAISCCLCCACVHGQTTIVVQQGEKWFGGAINDAHLMPFQNGYALDMIGGGEFGSFRDRGKLDEELMVRSAECSALMPMMQFSVAPWRVLSDSNLRIQQQMVAIRKTYTPYILELARSAAVSGEPIVRSMEYAFPGQGFSEEKGQFMLGGRFLVAPVLTKDGEKTVTLPKGRWRDDKGRVLKGPCQVRERVPLDRLPVYERIGRLPALSQHE